MSNFLANMQFDQAKPFYPLIVQYLIFLNGLKELPVRSIFDSQYESPDITVREQIEKELGKPINFVKLSSQDRVKVADSIKTLVKSLERVQGNLHLQSICSDPVEIDINALAKEIESDLSFQLSFAMRAASSMIILAHEFCKDHSYHNHDPLWEFLRHCRNAAAHGGAFTFRNREPRHPAEWRGIQILTRLQGTPLFKDETSYGLLSPGDPIYLLWDIEQAYPQIQRLR
jgi:hypothetical protein